MMKRLAVLAALALTNTGCGALFNNTTAQVTITTNAPGGEILVDGQPTGTQAPGVVKVHNHRSHVISVKMADGTTGTCLLPTSAQGKYIVLDVVFTALIGVIVDAATGAWSSVGSGCHVNVLDTGAPRQPQPGSAVPGPAPTPPAGSQAPTGS